MIIKIEISDKVINKATKCHANFCCLNDKENPKCSNRFAMCPVDIKIGDGLALIRTHVDFIRRKGPPDLLGVLEIIKEYVGAL